MCIYKKQNGHETDLEMSPGPLDTTIESFSRKNAYEPVARGRIGRN